MENCSFNLSIQNNSFDLLFFQLHDMQFAVMAIFESSNLMENLAQRGYTAYSWKSLNATEISFMLIKFL